MESRRVLWKVGVPCGEEECLWRGEMDACGEEAFPVKRRKGCLWRGGRVPVERKGTCGDPCELGTCFLALCSACCDVLGSCV